MNGGKTQRKAENIKRLLLYIVVCVGMWNLLFGQGLRVCAADPQELETEERILQDTKEKVMEEFDFSKIDESLVRMFPERKMKFGDLVGELLSGNTKAAGSLLREFAEEQFFYELRYNKKSLIYMLLIAVIAAVFSNFSSVLQNRQASEISFYILYMLLVTLCLGAFGSELDKVKAQIEMLLEFMKVLCPSYFIAVALAAGSVTSIFFYNVILFLILVAEILVLNFLIPVVHVYMMIRILSNLTGEDFLSQFGQLLEKLVSWSLKTMLACVVGINTIQGLLGPAIDTVKRSVLTKTVEAIPGIGNAAGSLTDMVLGAAVLIKNGIGMAGAVIAVAVCAVPMLEILLLAFLYKAVAAIVQPVSDRRVTGCIGCVSEGYELLVKIVFATAVMFLLTIAVIAGATT